MKFYSRSRKKVTVLNLFYKGAVNAYFLTGSFFKKTVVFEAAIFVGQSEDGAEVRCEVSRRVETAVSRYSGPSRLRFIVCPARMYYKMAEEVVGTRNILLIINFPGVSERDERRSDGENEARNSAALDENE